MSNNENFRESFYANSFHRCEKSNIFGLVFGSTVTVTGCSLLQELVKVARRGITFLEVNVLLQLQDAVSKPGTIGPGISMICIV